jgi:hypothetical protein
MGMHTRALRESDHAAAAKLFNDTSAIPQRCQAGSGNLAAATLGRVLPRGGMQSAVAVEDKQLVGLLVYRLREGSLRVEVASATTREAFWALLLRAALDGVQAGIAEHGGTLTRADCQEAQWLAEVEGYELRVLDDGRVVVRADNAVVARSLAQIVTVEHG